MWYCMYVKLSIFMAAYWNWHHKQFIKYHPITCVQLATKYQLMSFKSMVVVKNYYRIE